MVATRSFWWFYCYYLIVLLLCVAPSHAEPTTGSDGTGTFFKQINFTFFPTLNTQAGLRAQDPFGLYSLADPIGLWKHLGNELLKYWPPHEIPFFDNVGVFDEEACINPLRACYLMPINTPTEIAEKWTCFENLKRFLTYEYKPPSDKAVNAPDFLPGLTGELAYTLALANMFALEPPENMALYFEDQLRYHRFFNPQHMRQWPEKTVNDFVQNELKLFSYSVYFENGISLKTEKRVSDLFQIYSLLLKANPENLIYLFKFLWASLRYQRPVAPELIERFNQMTDRYYPQPDWLWLKAHIAINQSDWETALFWVYELQERFGNYEDINALHELLKTHVPDGCTLPIEPGTLSQFARQKPSKIKNVEQLLSLFENFFMALIEKRANSTLGPELPLDFPDNTQTLSSTALNCLLIVSGITILILLYFAWRQQWQAPQALTRWLQPTQQALTRLGQLWARSFVRRKDKIGNKLKNFREKWSQRFSSLRYSFRTACTQMKKTLSAEWRVMRANLTHLFLLLAQRVTAWRQAIVVWFQNLPQQLADESQVQQVMLSNQLALIRQQIFLVYQALLAKFSSMRQAPQQTKQTMSRSLVPLSPLSKRVPSHPQRIALQFFIVSFSPMEHRLWQACRANMLRWMKASLSAARTPVALPLRLPSIPTPPPTVTKAPAASLPLAPASTSTPSPPPQQTTEAQTAPVDTDTPPATTPPPPTTLAAETPTTSSIKVPAQIIAYHDALVEATQALRDLTKIKAIDPEHRKQIRQLYYLALFDKLLALVHAIQHYSRSDIFVFNGSSDGETRHTQPSLIRVLSAPTLDVSNVYFYKVFLIYEEPLAAALKKIIRQDDGSLLLAAPDCPITLPPVDTSVLNDLEYAADPQATICFYLEQRLRLNNHKLRTANLSWTWLDKAVIRGAIIKIGLAYQAWVAHLNAPPALSEEIIACLTTCQALATFFTATEPGSSASSKSSKLLACDQTLMKLAEEFLTTLTA